MICFNLVAVNVIASVWQIHLEINSLQNLPTFSPLFVALKLRLTHLSLENVDKDKVEFPADSVHLILARVNSAQQKLSNLFKTDFD